MTKKKWSLQDAKALYEEAERAGYAAGAGRIPTPMIVGEAIDLVSDAIDYSKPTYFVSEGACGFAWVVIPGNGSFAKALAKADVKVSPAYPKGVYVKWVSEYGQSVERKAAYASAFAKVLTEAGVEGAYSQSRLD